MVVVKADCEDSQTPHERPSRLRETPPAGGRLCHSFFRVKSAKDAQADLLTGLGDANISSYSLNSVIGRFDLAVRYWINDHNAVSSAEHEGIARLLARSGQIELPQPGQTDESFFSDSLFVPLALQSGRDDNGEWSTSVATQLKDPSFTTNRLIFDMIYAERRGFHRSFVIVQFPRGGGNWPDPHTELIQQLIANYGPIIEALSVSEPAIGELGVAVIEVLNTCAQHRLKHRFHRDLSSMLKPTGAQHFTLQVFDSIESRLLPREAVG